MIRKEGKKSIKWTNEEVFIPGIASSAYNTEMAFQTCCADWIRKQFELTKSDRFRYWHHSANERKGAWAGFMAKMMGQAKGFPDFIHPGLKLAIELKLPGKQARPEQIEWLFYFARIGWYSEVVFTLERFKEIVGDRELI